MSDRNPLDRVEEDLDDANRASGESESQIDGAISELEKRQRRTEQGLGDLAERTSDRFDDIEQSFSFRLRNFVFDHHPKMLKGAKYGGILAAIYAGSEVASGAYHQFTGGGEILGFGDCGYDPDLYGGIGDMDWFSDCDFEGDGNGDNGGNGNGNGNGNGDGHTPTGPDLDYNEHDGIRWYLDSNYGGPQETLEKISSNYDEPDIDEFLTENDYGNDIDVEIGQNDVVRIVHEDYGSLMEEKVDKVYSDAKDGKIDGKRGGN